jgi:uncharacterized damage-inducible protein DinB
MKTSEIQLLFDYHYWASNHLLSYCEKLTHAQLIAPNTFPSGTLKATLVHMLTAEWIWLWRCRDGISQPKMLDDRDFATLAEVRVRCKSEEQNMRAWLATIADADMEREITYSNTSGTAFNNVLWQILVHVVTHGMQHHAEIAQMLTDFGHSPGNIDLIVYLRSVRM